MFPRRILRARFHCLPARRPPNIPLVVLYKVTPVEITTPKRPFIDWVLRLVCSKHFWIRSEALAFAWVVFVTRISKEDAPVA